MPTKHLIRLDDISPGMAWTKFLPLKDKLEALGVKCILGVVPECRDPALRVEREKSEFFDFVRTWATYGDSITQHGTFHVYDSACSGLMDINRRSEFAGHSFDVQLERLAVGKDILIRERVWQPWFMAPAHSFDYDTLRALERLGFKAVTDGYGFYPYKIRSIVLVPQLASFPLRVGFGFETICIHINDLPKSRIESLLDFVRRNIRLFVDFKDVVPRVGANTLFQNGTRTLSACCLKWYRRARV